MSAKLIELNSQQGRQLGEWGIVESCKGWTRQAAVDAFCETGLAIVDQIDAEFAGLVDYSLVSVWRHCYEDTRRMTWTKAKQLISDISCYTENLIRSQVEAVAVA
jgi:hypothetical protein